MASIDEIGPPDDDTMRILVSTDNHLGYLERDPVRALDSFAALEEVLYLAKKYKVGYKVLSVD
jgi:double-strand break repair protein MRE11